MRAALLGLLLLISAAAAQAQEIVLRGVLTRADHETYVELPFRVPRGVEALRVAFTHDGADAHTVIDLGLFDPQRFRGWSGGNKSSVIVGETAATPSYLAGPLPSGRWRLLLGAPNVRPGTTTRFEAQITLYAREEEAFENQALIDAPGWYRGDFHLHSAHSDGSCAAQSGRTVPCPAFRLAEAAAERGLDFVFFTEHNTISQRAALLELQPAFDRLLLAPAREITTFQGHANVFGVGGFLDFRAGPASPALLAAVARADGLVAINHPALPTNEACLGCGWTATGADFSRFGAVEIVNGGAAAALTQSAEGPLSGIAFWHARLNEGLRLAGIAGSDNHEVARARDRFGALGKPATVVYAEALSEAALIAGVRAGRVFVDVDAVRGRALRFSAEIEGAHAAMGDAFVVPAGASVRYAVAVEGVEGARVEFIEDGAVVAAFEGAEASLTRASDGARHWMRVNVRDGAGRLVLIGNPIYLNWRS